jgi:hypothetical protein
MLLWSTLVVSFSAAPSSRSHAYGGMALLIRSRINEIASKIQPDFRSCFSDRSTYSWSSLRAVGSCPSFPGSSCSPMLTPKGVLCRILRHGHRQGARPARATATRAARQMTLVARPSVPATHPALAQCHLPAPEPWSGRRESNPHDQLESLGNLFESYTSSVGFADLEVSARDRGSLAIMARQWHVAWSCSSEVTAWHAAEIGMLPGGPLWQALCY